MTKGLDLIFVLEFEVSVLRSFIFWDRGLIKVQNLEDRDYYLDTDPAHDDFKVSIVVFIQKR